MGTQFTLPPDTRAVGTGNPPADMNAVVDAVTAMGAGYNVLNAAFSGGADPTGVADSTAAINAASAAGVAILPPGTFLLNSSTPLTGPVRGAGIGLTFLKIGASFTGAAAISVTADAVEVADLGIIGASGTTTSNPVCNGIEVTGAGRVKVRDIWFKNINGWCFEAAATASKTCVDMMVARLIGRNCAGGIHDLGVTGTSFLGEHFFTDLQFQQMGVTTGGSANLDILLIEDVTDVLVQGINAGTAASATGCAIHVKGACSTVKLTNVDVGANQAAGVAAAIFIESGANGTPSDVTVINGGAEGGNAVCRVDAGNDLVLTNLRMHQGYTAGLDINGGDVRVMACSFASNNQAGGTGYDIDTSGMSSGNARFITSQTETALGSGAGLVTNPVNTSTHAYFIGCFFVGTGTAPSNVFNGTPQQVQSSVGYNPRGQVTAATITASPFTPGTYQTPLMVIFTAINGMTQFAIGGVAVPLPAVGVPYPIGVRQSMTITWATTAPTWAWFGL